MPLSAALEADFSEFTSECAKAVEALQAMTAQAQSATEALQGIGAEKPGEAIAEGAEKATPAIKGANDASKQFLGTLKEMAGAVGISFTVGGVIAFGKSVLDAADKLNTTAERTGLTIEQVQRLDYIAKQSGGSIDNMTAALDTLHRKMETVEGQHAIEDLGLDFRALRAADPYDQLRQIGAALETIPNPAKQAAAELELLGRTGAKVAPSLGAEFDKLASKATVASDAQVKASAAAAQAMVNAKDTIIAAAIEAGGSLIIAGKKVADDPTSLWSLMKEMGKFGTGAGLMTFAANAAAGGAAQLGPPLPEEFKGPGKPAAADLGETPEEKAERERRLAEARREGEAAAKAQAEAEAELAIVRQGSETVLASMTDAEINAIQSDLEHGASQSTLVAAYGASGAAATEYAAKVKAVAEAYEGERAVAKIVRDETRAADEERRNLIATRTQREILAIDQWREKTLEALAETGRMTQEAYDAVVSIANDRLALVGVEWDEVREGTRAALQDTVDRAQRTYEILRDHDDRYTATAVEHAQLRRDKAVDALDGIIANWDKLESESIATLDKQAAADQQTYDQALRNSSNYSETAIENFRKVAEASQRAADIAKGLQPVAEAGMGAVAGGADKATGKVNETTAAVQRLGATITAISSQQYEMLARQSEFDAQANRQAGGGGGAFFSANDYARLQEEAARKYHELGATASRREEYMAGGATWGRQGSVSTTTSLNVNVNSTDAKTIADRLVGEMKHQGIRF